MANHRFERYISLIISGTLLFGVLFTLSIPSHAIPVYARQTGQNCLSCHAGGQFPELTPYGRLFKLTGYTMGSRTIPLAMMAWLDATHVRNTKDSTGAKDSWDFPKQDSLVFDVASVFVAGKITDNLGLFSQWTYANYDHLKNDPLGPWAGYFGPDNTELRYADRFISPSHDLIVGGFVNNNPSMQDVWNTAPAWSYPYISSSFAPGAPAAPMLDDMLAQNSVGAGIYAYLNQSIYGELSLYKTANGPFGFLHPGKNDAISRIKGAAPYWRLAYTKEWGPSNLMVGTTGMVAKIHEPNADGVSDTSLPTDRYEDYGLDAQYQYLLDPHTVTVNASYMHEKATWGDPTLYSNSSDTLKEFKVKGTYVYKAKYGVSLAYNQITGSTDPGFFGGPADVTGNLNNSPDTTSWTPEVFWTPVQYLRIGAQYWHFTKFNGASSNYDGFGRNASDNDTLFFYLWGAY